jgi:hypothetical protein
MTTLALALEMRREEFDAHFALAHALEDRMLLEFGVSIGTVNLSARHINTLKSGLIVHLYNIEEAIMSEVFRHLGAALGSADPRRWTEHSLREWLRESIVSRTVEGSEEVRLKTVYETSSLLLTTPALGPQTLKKPSGTWDDKGIGRFAKRMNVTFDMPPDMWQRIAETPEYGDRTPMQFLAERRNAIAHGRRSFEDGASDLGLSDIRKLADVTLDYMRYAVNAFSAHIENNAHLVPGI